MKGVREPLLWIALASLATVVPFPQVAIPACATLALSIQLLSRTRPGAHSRTSLRIAATGAGIAFVLNALLLTPLGAAAFRIAILSVPLALLALANSLRRIARSGAMEDESWFSGVQSLFAAAVVAGLWRTHIASSMQLLTAPLLAFLVLEFRRQFPLENAR